MATEQFLPKVKIICDVTFKNIPLFRYKLSLEMEWSSFGLFTPFCYRNVLVQVPICHQNDLCLATYSPPKWSLFVCKFAIEIASVWVPIFHCNGLHLGEGFDIENKLRFSRQNFSTISDKQDPKCKNVSCNLIFELENLKMETFLKKEKCSIQG